MPFITDRDLLILEPDLFRDVGFLAQRLITTTGSITSGKLNVSGVDFVAAAIAPGHVVVHGPMPLEVILRNSATQLTVSLLRASIADAPLSPPNTGSLAAVIFTFAPQIAAAHAAVLNMLGLPAAGTGLPGETDETAITNPRALAMLESLLTLSLIWSAAAAVSGASSNAASRADSYRLRAAIERASTAARLDLNADGIADAHRSASSGTFIRG